MLKKSILVVLSLILVLAFASSAFASEAKSLNAVKGTPVIDGEIDVIWSNSSAATDFVQSGVKLTTFETDIKPSAKAMWDDKFLYVLVEVKDSKVGGTATGDDNFNNDSVEVYLDQNNAKTKRYEADDMSVVIDYQGNFSGYITKDFKPLPQGIVSAGKKVSDGYVIEVAIPWTTGAPKADSIIGFDLAINDNTIGGNQRTSWVHWNDASSEAWQDTSVFGNLKLIEAAAKPAESTTGNPKTGDSSYVYFTAIILTGIALIVLKRKSQASSK